MLTLLLLLLQAGASAQEVSGFTELRLQAYAGVDAPVPLQVVERFRPTFTGPLAERVVLTTTVEAGLAQGWSTQRAFQDRVETEGLSPALADLVADAEVDNAFLQISSADDYLAVDRLYAELQLESADVRIGRQALNWGSAFLVNPSDPFPEILLTEPWKPRSGINAVRVDVPIGDLHGVQMVAGSDDAFGHPRLAGRATVNGFDTDWSLVGAWREEIDEGIVGVDFKGTLGVGFWFEGVVHLPAGAEPYEEFATGIDYSFPVLEQLVLTAQVYRNGAGSREPTTSLFEAPQPFAPVFRGRDYGMASVMAGLTRDVSLSTLWIQNLDDGTAYVVPSLFTLPTGSMEISLAAQIPIAFSGGGEFKPAPRQLRVNLPTADGSVTRVDLAGLVPDATLILWTRLNF